MLLLHQIGIGIWTENIYETMILSDNDAAALDGHKERHIAIHGQLAHRLQSVDGEDFEDLVLLADVDLVLMAAHTRDSACSRQLLFERRHESAGVEYGYLVVG